MFQVFLIIFIACISISMLYPFLHVLSISFSTPAEALRPGIHLFPREISLNHGIGYSHTDTYGLLLGNTVFRTVVGTTSNASYLCRWEPIRFREDIFRIAIFI